MKIDREYQKELLEILMQQFPQPLGDDIFNEKYAADEDKFVANLLYLHWHGLVSKGIAEMATSSGIAYCPIASKIQITQRGIDFLQDDGGLGAILNVVTVKLHADTIRDLIESHIQMSGELAPDEKKAMTDHLKDLPAEGLKALLTGLIGKALDNAPEAIEMLKSMLLS